MTQTCLGSQIIHANTDFRQINVLQCCETFLWLTRFLKHAFINHFQNTYSLLKYSFGIRDKKTNQYIISFDQQEVDKVLVQVKICVDDVKKVCKDVTDIRCREGETIECRDEIKEVNQSQRGERFLFNLTRSLGRSAPQSTGTPVATRTKQSAPPSSSPTVSLRRSRR